jgi:hypothetical protein
METFEYQGKYITASLINCPYFGSGFIIVETKNQFLARIRAEIEKDEQDRRNYKLESQNRLNQLIGVSN